MKERISALDGVRGIAVTLVMLFHTGAFAPGWIGVQIFFVLSGYLISDILLNQKNRPFSTYLTEFFRRRSLRIFPLYYFFLAAMFAMVSLAGAAGLYSSDWPYLLSYTTNFGRFRLSDIEAPFTHLWSLAVEEQFYLVWPIIVYVLSFVSLKRFVVFCIFFVPLVRLGIYLTLYKAGFDEQHVGRIIYCFPLSHFDAFAIGGAIAIFKLHNAKAAPVFLVALTALTAVLGVLVLGYQHLVFKAAFWGSFGYQMYLLPAGGFFWGYSLLNLLSAALIVCAIQRPTYLRILENPLLVRVGVVSYGVYIYHVPVLLGLEWAVGQAAPRLVVLVLYFSLVFAIAELSFRRIERPFLVVKDRVNS